MTAPASPIDKQFDGRTPLISDVNAHPDENELFFVEFKNLAYRANRKIQKRNGATIIGASAGERIVSMHSFTYYDGAGVPSYVKYRTHGTVIEATTGAAWAAMTIPYAPTGGSRWVFSNHFGRVFAVNGNEAMIVSAGQPGDAWRKVGQVSPLVAPSYSLTANDAPVTNASTGTTVSATKGTPIVNCTGASFVVGAPWVGKRMVIDGRAYEIAAVGATNQLTLTEDFKEATGAGLSWAVYRGVGDWDDGPWYAFAYYNPTTGHISNISPIQYVAEKNQFGRTPTIVIAASAAHQNAYLAGYVKIQLFRTPLNGDTLCALNELLDNVNSAVTTITYVETAVKFQDTYLTKGTADQWIRRAPVDSLGVALKFLAIASYKGRLWAITRNRLYWSASLDEVPYWQVPDECWPASFSRPIPESFGLIVAGQEGSSDQLVIQTAEGDYTVQGYDNYDMDVIPLRRRDSGCFLGGGAIVDGRLVELFRDRRLFDAQLGDIAQPIQNRLNDIPAALTTSCRMHWFSLGQRDYLLASIPGSTGSADVDTLMIYDYSAEQWIEAMFAGGVSGITAFATVKDANGSLELWVGDRLGGVYRISDSTVWRDNGSDYQPQLKTSIMRFGVRVRLSHVQAFVNDPAQLWTLKMYLDENTAEDGPATNEKRFKAVALAAARHTEQSAQGREMTFKPTSSDRVSAEAFQFALLLPLGNALFEVEKIIFTFNVLEPGGQP